MKTAVGEGRDLKSAIEQGATELGIEMTRALHKIDLTHFRSQTGVSRAMQTVKVVVWEAPEGEAAPSIFGGGGSRRRDDDRREADDGGRERRGRGS